MQRNAAWQRTGNFTEAEDKQALRKRQEIIEVTYLLRRALQCDYSAEASLFNKLISSKALAVGSGLRDWNDALASAQDSDLSGTKLGEKVSSLRALWYSIVEAQVKP